MLDLLGLSCEKKMFIRLFLQPMMFLVAACLVLFLGEIFYERTSQSVIGQQIAYCFSLLSIPLMVLGLITTLYSIYRWWKFMNAEDTNSCQACGGIVSEKHGKYGIYYKCLACSATHSFDR